MSNMLIKDLVPPYYDGIIETDELFKVEQAMVDIFGTQVQRLMANQFAKTANESGITLFEQLLKILPDLEKDSLEFRRLRVLNRLSSLPPFTYRFFLMKFDELIGAGKYELTVDYSSRTMYLDSRVVDQVWFHEISATVHQLKPANLVFINRPAILEQINVSEAINLQALQWNYKLGSWKLGAKPFTEAVDKGAIKMPEIKSIQNALTVGVASFIASDIAKVKLNDSIIITDFLLKSSTDNDALIQYEVLATAGLTEITNIKLLSAADEVLTNSTVYVPVLDNFQLRHTIKVKEGI